MANPAVPILTGGEFNPWGHPTIGKPVSVCHQWSITGTPSLFEAHLIVSVSALSPAKNNVFSELVSYLLINSPLGSLRFIALNAVGAVNNIFT